MSEFVPLLRVPSPSPDVELAMSHLDRLANQMSHLLAVSVSVRCVHGASACGGEVGIDECQHLCGSSSRDQNRDFVRSPAVTVRGGLKSLTDIVQLHLKLAVGAFVDGV